MKMEVNDKNYLRTLEDQLFTILQPVTPRQEFIGELEEGLFDFPAWKIKISEMFRLIILFIAGIVGGVLILITGVRVITMIIGTLSIYRRERANLR